MHSVQDHIRVCSQARPMPRAESTASIVQFRFFVTSLLFLIEQSLPFERMLPILRVLDDFFNEWYATPHCSRDYSLGGFRKFMIGSRSKLLVFNVVWPETFALAVGDLHMFFDDCFPVIYES